MKKGSFCCYAWSWLGRLLELLQARPKERMGRTKYAKNGSFCLVFSRICPEIEKSLAKSLAR
jgi:hypothetical protein